MTRSSALPLIAALVVATAAGCDNRGPAFIEQTTIRDTDLEEGPYEVRVVLKDPSGIGSVRVLYAPQGQLSAASDLVELTPATADFERPRYQGGIPGFPLGTVVEWGVEACDTLGNCALDPPLFPLDSHRFRVGLIPSDPAVTDLSPEEGPSSGGTRVVIDGEDLRPGAEVRFGLQPAPHVEWIDTSRIVVRTPPHEPGTVDVIVRNPDTLEARSPGGFTFTPAPELTAVEPANGPTAGGTEVIVTGGNFNSTTRAFFDGVPCRHLSFVDPSLLTCTTPPGVAGFVDVEVQNDDGGFAVLEEGFEYIAPPVVDDVTPDRGTDLGGTVIEVFGENIDEGATVVVGETPCVEVEWVSEELIRCTVPPGTPGIVDVTVINEDGQSAAMVGGFNYLGPPVVVQVLPPMGPILGGVEVRIIGAGFSEDMFVTFGGAEAQIVDVVDDLELVVMLPPSTLPLVPAPESGLAPVDVFVQNLDPSDMRSDLEEDAFSYIWPPEVFEVIPPSGPTEGGTPVTVVGRFFREIPPAPIELFFGETPAESVAVLSSTTISAITPPGPPGFVDVTVRNYENSEGTLEDGYLYVPPPEVIDVVPGAGPTFGGERVTIVGEFFQEGAVVFFEGVGACTDVVFISDTELECTTPPSPEPGLVDVIVTNPDGQEGEGVQLYEYVPVVVDPDFGLEGGFTRVRVLAAGMAEGVTIRFGDTIASDCDRLSSTEVVCQSPPAASAGFVDVSFQNPNGTGDEAESAFEYRRYANETDERAPRTFLASNHVEDGDVDLDGDPDLVVANGSPGLPQESYLLLNDGDGFFDRETLPGGEWTANSADFGDLNNDDLPDLVLGVSQFGGAILYVNEGNGEFEFLNAPVGSFTPTGAFDAVLSDLVGGPRDDLLILTIGCSNDPNADCTDFDVGRDGLFEQTGPSQWADRSGLMPHDLGLVHDHKIADPDLDGDGDRDLVLFVDNGTPEFATVGNEHRILYNRVDEGLGFVEDRTPFEGLVGDVFGVTYGDIDGDNDPDVLAGNCNPPFGSSEVVYLNQGGTLERSFSALPTETNDCDWGVALFDADTDGDLDVAFVGARAGSLQLKLYVNDGTGTFHPSHQSLPAFPIGVQQARGAELAAADFDGDGDLDVALAGTDAGGNFGVGTLEILMLVEDEEDAP